jgi:oxygen-independent coproporphyrinogen III oxidase
MDPRSLYIHIPFCKKKCRYCDFYSVPYEASLADAYLAALALEIEFYKKRILAEESAPVQTIFIGGGTPTMLTADQLRRLCSLVRTSFRLAPDCEWTVECNPDSFTAEKADVLNDAGVTRLTFGFQSLDDRELRLLGRVHTADRCREVLADPVLVRFSSIGIDIMYGLPGQTVETLERSLGPVFDSPYVKHISAYELTVADGTPFGRHRSLFPLPDDDAMTVMTGRLWELLAATGFKQYEVSNFAKAEHACRHNMACWAHESYLGLGCAAHSFLPPERFANMRDVYRYILEVRAGRLPREFTETLDRHTLGVEMILLGLRTVQGINEDDFLEKIGYGLVPSLNKGKLSFFTDKGLLLYEKPFLKPTRKGLLMADALARELL